MKQITFMKIKDTDILTILFSFISFQFCISLHRIIKIKNDEKEEKGEKKLEEHVILLSFYLSEVLSIICFYLFKKYEKNNSFNTKTIVYGCVLGFLNFSYKNFLTDVNVISFGYSFISSIICYEILLKNFEKKKKLITSLIIILLFIILIRSIIFTGSYGFYTYYFYSAIGLGIQLAFEKYSIEKEELNIYLLMFFEGVSSSIIHYTYHNLYDHNYESIKSDNFEFLIYFFFVYFVLNLTRFYLTKYSSLLMNILIMAFANIYFEKNVDLLLYDLKDIAYMFFSLGIFLGMCIYNEIIILNFLNKENNSDENKPAIESNENNVIQSDNKIENNNINILDKKEDTNED